MFRIDLNRIQTAGAELEHYAAALKNRIYEINELQKQMTEQSDLREFIKVLECVEKRAIVQSVEMTQMADFLVKMSCCLNATEKKIVQEYEQERFVHSKHQISLVSVGSNRLQEMGIQMRF